MKKTTMAVRGLEAAIPSSMNERIIRVPNVTALSEPELKVMRRTAYSLPPTILRKALCIILLFVIAMLFLAALPLWPYSAWWGFYPSTVLGVIFFGLWIVQLAASLIA